MMDGLGARLHNQPMVVRSETFGERFRRLREGRRLTLRKLSEELNVATGRRITAQAMSKWEKGGDIHEQHLEAVARYFGRSASWFRYGIDLPGPTDEADITILRVLKRAPITTKRELLDYLRFRIENNNTVPLAAEERARYAAELPAAAQDLPDP